MNALIRDRHTNQPLRIAGTQTQGPGLKPPLAGTYLGQRHPIDLRSADLRGVDLRGADVTGRDFSDADLTGARLDGVRFDVRTLWPEGVDPVRLGAIQTPVDLGGAKCDDADFSGWDLVDANANGAQLRRARFDGADLTRASLAGARCVGASFREATLCEANLTAADFTDADLTGADLTGATWSAQTRWPSGFTPPDVGATAPESPATTRESLAARFKALGDPTRLALLGLLLTDERTGEELAGSLGISEPTVSHHLARLRELELISVRPDGTRRLHRADPDRLRHCVADLPERLAELTRRDVDPDAYARKVLDAFFEGGRLKEIPARQKKQRIVLERLVQEFARDARYSEREVNATLKRFHEDVATLRRLFIAERLMARENSIYWRL